MNAKALVLVSICIGAQLAAITSKPEASIDSRGTSGGMGSNQLKLTSFSRWKYILSIHESENIPIWTIYQLLPFVAKKTPLFHGQCPIFHPGLGYRMISDIGSDILVCVLFCLYIYTMISRPFLRQIRGTNRHHLPKSNGFNCHFPHPHPAIQRPASHCSAQPHH